VNCFVPKWAPVGRRLRLCGVIAIQKDGVDSGILIDGWGKLHEAAQRPLPRGRRRFWKHRVEVAVDDVGREIVAQARVQRSRRLLWDLGPRSRLRKANGLAKLVDNVELFTLAS
jgi:hypothetical protein